MYNTQTLLFSYTLMFLFTPLITFIQTPLGILAIGALAIVTVLIIWIVRLELRLHKILLGKGVDIESALLTISKENKDFKKFQHEMEQYLTSVEKRLQRSIQSVETVRFNAFDGVGANQSFATAFLDEKGTGVIVSSLYARDRTSVFSKPIKTYASDFGLIEEEHQVVQKVKQSHEK